MSSTLPSMPTCSFVAIDRCSKQQQQLAHGGRPRTFVVLQGSLCRTVQRIIMKDSLPKVPHSTETTKQRHGTMARKQKKRYSSHPKPARFSAQLKNDNTRQSEKSKTGKKIRRPSPLQRTKHNNALIYNIITQQTKPQSQ